MRICRWYAGKKAALSLRFDDSHPTHIERAVPMLNEHGLVGTFLVNPGNSSYQKYKTEWETTVVEQGHELGDHTLSHVGARTDREAEQQVGEPAELIRAIQPERKLITFVGGGATLWLQRKPLSYFMAKYGLYRLRGPSMSCSEEYASFSADRFERRLDRAIAEGDHMQAHFHPVGEGHLYISPPVFREVLGHARARRDDIWSAGLSAIHQYEEERDRSALWARALDDDALELHFVCATDADVYRQPLTLEVPLPAPAAEVSVLGPDGQSLDTRIEAADGAAVARFDVPPVDAIYTVRAPGLGAAIEAKSGPDVAAPGPHPYLFFTRDDLPALQEKAKRAPADEIWQRIKGDADELVEGDRSEWSAGDSYRRNSERVRCLAFTYALTGDRIYADRAILELEALMATDSWWTPNEEALRTAAVACTLGLAYDWMWDALTDDQRERVRATIVEHGVRPVLEATDERVWWTHWYRCNWGAVIYGQTGVAVLSLLADEPEAADWARLMRRKIWHYVQALGPDGGWGESGSYGAYAWYQAILFMDALRHVTDGATDLSDDPSLARLSDWFAQLLAPSGSDFIPFSDCDRGLWRAWPVLYQLAGRYRDGHAQWFADRASEKARSADVFGFLWCDPELRPEGPADLPVTKLFSGIDWAILRNRWDDPQAVLFAFKGGQKDWDHHHHDINSFVLYAYGQPLLVDLWYPHKVWGCETEAHNTIMVNGKDQRGHLKVAGARGQPEHRGIIGDLVAAPWYARFVGDGSLAYDQEDVNSFVREVMYLRRTDEAGPPDYFVLFDDVDAAAPAAIDWLLHTYGKLDVRRNRFTFTQDEAAVDVTLAAPETVTHEVIQKDFEEVGSRKPFERAEALTILKVRPAEKVERGFFLSVLVPRPASASPEDVPVTAIRAPNIVGAAVTSGATRDVALFALDAPEISAAGIESLGRSCFVRRSGDRISAAALHNGQRLSADGTLLFETNSCGHAVIAFGEDAVTARLDLYDSQVVRIHCPRPPAKVLVDGDEREFEYEAERQCVRLDGRGRGEIQIILR